ncbi:hypothetical protein LGM90_29220 [Burkholderia sp. AU28942]|uniref:hypothetical protein n=1 Tax=Burkholderia TaxID=32008 RepID=UPI0008412827|nr:MULTISPECIES: hypothetical protein [Burkholderia]AOK06000.1 hypothetical protein WK25_15635 [Burkholderia latens]MCA8312595.1 hypothetical protein [Burkholderia sp. AU28942]QTO52634.1 hypothetical protein J8I86_29460 [Burkholderia latens]
MVRSIARGRRPLSKAQLLPLPTADVQRLSMKHHLALAALRTGHADVEPIATLMNVVYLAFFLRDRGDRDLARYRDAETVLANLIARVDAGDGAPGAGALTDAERAALARLVVQLDAQLAAASMQRLANAWTRVERVACSGGRSPIPAAE